MSKETPTPSLFSAKDIIGTILNFIPQALQYLGGKDEELANTDQIAHIFGIPTAKLFIMNKAAEAAGGESNEATKLYETLNELNDDDPQHKIVIEKFKKATKVPILLKNGSVNPEFLEKLSESSEFYDMDEGKRNKFFKILKLKKDRGLGYLLDKQGRFKKAVEAKSSFAPTQKEIIHANDTSRRASDLSDSIEQWGRRTETGARHQVDAIGPAFTSMYNPEAVMNLQEGISDGSLPDGTNPEKIRKIKAVINTIGNTIGDSFTSPYNAAESVKNQVARLNEEKSTSQSLLSKHFENKTQSLIRDNSDLGTLIEQEASQSSRLAPVDALNSPDSSVSSVVENASDFHPENFAPETDSSSATDGSIGTLPTTKSTRPRVSKTSQISVVRQNVSKAPSVNAANNAVKNLRQKIVQQKNALSAKGQKFPNKTSPNVRKEGNTQALAKSIEKSDKVQKETISAQQVQRDSIHNATSNNTANCTYQTEIRTGDIIVNDAHTEDPLKFGDQVEQVITDALNRTSRIFNPNIAI